MADAVAARLKEKGIPLPPTPQLGRILGYAVAWTVFVNILIWGWVACDIRVGELIRDSGNMVSMVVGETDANGVVTKEGFFPPDLRLWNFYTSEMIITLHMAIWGSLLAVISAVPFALLGSANIAPWWIRHPTRRLMDAARAINELVFALIFVAAVGLGPMAGILALWVHTTGILAKLFSEAVEAIDQRPVDGITATGTGKLQEVLYGVIPQVIPLWISFALYRFESNVRAATVVGIVGAGGIGMVLHESIKSFEYANTATIMLIIILAVVLIDILSGFLRKLYL